MSSEQPRHDHEGGAGLSESPPTSAYGALGCGIVGLFSLPYPAIAVSSALIATGHGSAPLIVATGLLFGAPTVALGVVGLRATSPRATRGVAIAGIVLGALTAVACVAAGLFGLALSTRAGR